MKAKWSGSAKAAVGGSWYGKVEGAGQYRISCGLNVERQKRYWVEYIFPDRSIERIGVFPSKNRALNACREHEVKPGEVSAWQAFYREAGLPPEALEFEIGPDSVFHNPERLKEVMEIISDNQVLSPDAPNPFLKGR